MLFTLNILVNFSFESRTIEFSGIQNSCIGDSNLSAKNQNVSILETPNHLGRTLTAMGAISARTGKLFLQY